VIAIDGPAAVGKSTAGRRLAGLLGYLFLDTGAIYRALTLLALREGAGVADGRALAALATSMALEIVPAPADSGRLYTVYLEGADQTREIRGREVDATVSAVSEHREVRDALLPIQRRLGRARAVVVGRDIGTVVLPDADRKVYLDASLRVRARRGLADLRGTGGPADLDTMLAEIRRRDDLDSSRSVAPLRRADDAITIVTDHLTEDDVVDLLFRVCCAGLGCPGDTLGR
jgi:cytidylate kinase